MPDKRKRMCVQGTGRRKINEKSALAANWGESEADCCQTMPVFSSSFMQFAANRRILSSRQLISECDLFEQYVEFLLRNLTQMR